MRRRWRGKVDYVRGNFIEPVSRPDERWSLDFMYERIENGRSMRTLAIVDDFRWEVKT